MAESLAQRAARIYDQNGTGAAITLWNKQLNDGTRKTSDPVDDLWRAAANEANAREWRSIHRPTADEFAKKAREQFIAHFSREDQ